MPRFGLKALLITLAVVALWFAIFSIPDPTRRGREQLHLCMLLAILVAAGFAAIYFRGKRQAFWSGFFAAMLLLYGRFPHMPDITLVANSWTSALLRLVSANDRTVEMLYFGISAALLLSFSTVMGLIVAAIYDQSQPRK